MTIYVVEENDRTIAHVIGHRLAAADHATTRLVALLGKNEKLTWALLGGGMGQGAAEQPLS